jgi:hypothetical protein
VGTPLLVIKETGRFVELRKGKGWSTMLDKSMPYYNVIMKRRADFLLSKFTLPQGYSFAWNKWNCHNSIFRI